MATRVLVVDDSEDTVAAVSIGLGELGFDVRGARDGVSALETAAQFEPDAALIYLSPPIIDGWELAGRLRSHAGFKRPRLVALTCLADAKLRNASLAAGFDEYLVKPASLRAIRAALSACGVAHCARVP